MATFLELVQRLSRESGSISGSASPNTVTGQQGRLRKLVDWTASAWTDIQNSEAGWRFLNRSFTGELTQDAAIYSAASFNIADFGAWLIRPDSFSMWPEDDGIEHEGLLSPLRWEQWRNLYQRGGQPTNQPVHYAVTPQDGLAFGPIPDRTYVVRGEYVATPQILTANDDVPACPVRFHDIVVWRALIAVLEYDEASAAQIANARQRYRRGFDDLRRDQLPPIQYASEPIA